MHTLVLTTETAADAKLLADFLSKMKTVKSIIVDPPAKKEYKTGKLYPLTDEEHALLLKTEEESPNMLAEEAEAYSEELIKKWSKKK